MRRETIRRNPFGSTNCIRFLGYDLSHRVAPLCLYRSKVSEKGDKKKVNQGLFHHGVGREWCRGNRGRRGHQSQIRSFPEFETLCPLRPLW